MSTCIYCIDNDILKKLATFELFEQTLELFNSSYEQVKVLETAKYKFRGDWKKFKKGKLKKKEDQIINYKKVVELAGKLPRISEAYINQQVFEDLSNFGHIDVGEAILTSYAIAMLQKDESLQLLTGDKKFLKALAQANLPIVQELLEHRFWCLEQLILKNIQGLGFEAVRDSIVPVRECDKTIKAVFGSGHESSQENASTSLLNYIENLRSETGNLLSLYPKIK